MRGDDLEPERWNVESQRGKSSGSDGSPHARDPRPGAHEVNLEAYVRSPERLRANPEASTGKPKRQDANPKAYLGTRKLDGADREAKTDYPELFDTPTLRADSESRTEPR